MCNYLWECWFPIYWTLVINYVHYLCTKCALKVQVFRLLRQSQSYSGCQILAKSHGDIYVEALSQAFKLPVTISSTLRNQSLSLEKCQESPQKWQWEALLKSVITWLCVFILEAVNRWLKSGPMRALKHFCIFLSLNICECDVIMWLWELLSVIFVLTWVLKLGITPKARFLSKVQSVHLTPVIPSNSR